MRGVVWSAVEPQKLNDSNMATGRSCKHRVNFYQFCYLTAWFICIGCEIVNGDDVVIPVQKHTVLIAFFARNKAHTLPHFLTLLHNLDYPKHRISFWIRSDHNIDNTADIVSVWSSNVKSLYHSVDYKISSSKSSYFEDEKGPFHWSDSRFRQMIRYKDEALEAARKMWADFIWFLDCDVFLNNNQTLNILMSQKKTLVAPVLESLGMYSNYWCGMNDKFYYQRTEEYMPILERKKQGTFEVPMIHSCVLVDLRHEASLKLAFNPAKIENYEGPEDDIIAFALSAKTAGAKMYVTNVAHFGYIMYPLEVTHQLQDDLDQLRSLRVEILVENAPLPTAPFFDFDTVPRLKADKFGFDEVYMINLVRRPERRSRMMASFQEMGVRAMIMDAVDGRLLNDTYLAKIGVKMMPEYADPYHKRPLTMGEIGCFLSHFNVWKDVVLRSHNTVIVFEDDIRFEPFFRRKLQNLMAEADRVGLKWDLIYLGRKRLLEKDEPFVDGASTIVRVEYSYWTLCYMLTLEGARKLLHANPLANLVPVDEFLPIMFDKHPDDTWKGHFSDRSLRAFSAAPLLVYPTHYTGDTNYISDTEDSTVIPGTPGKSSREEL